MLWLYHLRPAVAIPGWSVALFAVLVVPWLLPMSVIPLMAAMSKAMIPKGDAQIFPGTEGTWAKLFCHWEFAAFPLAIALIVLPISWRTTRPFDEEQFSDCVRHMHADVSLQSLANNLRANPNASRDEFDRFCATAYMAELSVRKVTPASVEELLKMYGK